MAAPPMSAFLPDGGELTSSAQLAVRVERDGDGVRVVVRDRHGWWWIAHCEPAEINGRKGYSGVAVQQAVPEAMALPGESVEYDPAPVRTKPRGLAPLVLK